MDIKGTDFRARHKPPVKAFDFLASGVPFATNVDSSPSEHLAEMGFRVASPDDPDHWLSREYFDETIRFGRILRTHLVREQIADRWAGMLEDVLEANVRSTTRRDAIARPAEIPTETGSAEAGERPDAASVEPRTPSSRSTRVAILSLLFNWPSTGGGTIHTYEAAKFLQQAGYDVRHVYARHDGWGLGRVTQPLAVPSRELVFDERTWNADEIRRQFRTALNEFSPDSVIVTDSWNTKPLLAEAAAAYPYYIRLAALECLCPLNNVRLLVDEAGRPSACPLEQLASPDACRRCVGRNDRFSGTLHRAERALAGFDQTDYSARLRAAFAQAAGVLAVNPAIADMVRPFAKAVHVVPSGFDPARFDLARLDAHLPPKAEGKTRLFFAGLTQEYMKGFSVLQAACERLWRVRQDFELVATGEPEGPLNEFTRYVGWLSQDELPRHIRAADVLVFPTIAEEALGRSAVEAMACGRPVVASRIGGLPFTVIDGETGLLFEPGSSFDLLTKLTQLLDHPDLRQRLGDAGRQRFESQFTWNVMLEHHARILGPAVRRDQDHADGLRDGLDRPSIQPERAVAASRQTPRQLSSLDLYREGV